MPEQLAARPRRLTALVVATALCYAIGYPLAIAGHSNVGWVFVALGGPLLLTLGVIVIRRVHASLENPADEPAPTSPAGE